MFKEYLERVREKEYLIHTITNYVSINDVANIILAVGARPIMAENIKEVEEVVKKADSLCLNIGMINEEKAKSMILAGKAANKLGKNVVLDPVGVGVSSFRKNIVKDILENVDISVIKGNAKEIKDIGEMLGLKEDETIEDIEKLKSEQKEEYIDNSGVDSKFEISSFNIMQKIKFVKEISKKTKAIVISTGNIDFISDGENVYCVYNGIEEMKKITGTGCMLAGLVATFIAEIKIKKDMFKACIAAVSSFGYAAECAKEKMKKEDIRGNISLRNYMIDELYAMDTYKLEENVKCKQFI